MQSIRPPLIAWPPLLDRRPLDLPALAVTVLAQIDALDLPYAITIAASESTVFAHRPLVLDKATGQIVYQGTTSYFDPRAAYDAAIAYARHIPAILAGGPTIYRNYYFKVRDGKSEFISGLPLPGDEPGIVRGYTFIECTFNVDRSYRFIDCVFVCCAPHGDSDNDTLEGCTIDGPIVC